MQTLRFHSSLLFSLLLSLALLSVGNAIAEEPEATPTPEATAEASPTPEETPTPSPETSPTPTPEPIACTDCAAEQQAASDKAADISTAQNDIQTLKDEIESDLSDISITAEGELDADFALTISDLITDSGCATETEYGDIMPDISGAKGYLYDAVFYCPDADSLETFVTNGFEGQFAAWSTDYDPDNTAAWEAVSAKFVQLESDLDDYFAALSEYAQALAAAQDCVESMRQAQTEGQCTETDIDHDEEDIPEDFDDPVDCPECDQLAADIAEIEADLTAIETMIADKNQEIADLNDQLSVDEQFATDLVALFASVNCDTESAFEDITVESGQAAGVIYGQTYYCQNEADVESLIAALETFWETHEAPSGDETIIDQINDLLADIETLQDEYNALIAELVMAQESYQDCLNTLLSLQEEGYCQADEEDEDTEDDTEEDEGTIEEPEVGESVTIPANKRRSGSGGSSKSLNYCDYALFSDFVPEQNTVTKQLTAIAYTAKSTVKLDTLQLTVAGQAIELTATKNTDGTYAVVGNLSTPITTSGKYRVEIFGQDKSSPVCARQRLYTIEVDSRIGTVDNPDTPEDESAGIPQEGDLFSDVEFSDIEGHWAKEFILKLAQRGIIEGYGNGKFGPDNNITRAELTKIALEAFAIGKMDTQTNPFPDVDAVQWYAPYIAQAKALLIVSGYPDGNFLPNNSVTRGEGLKILLGAANIDTSAFADTVSGFDDVEVSAFYNQYVNWAVDKGIVSGYGNGDFGPNDTLTRGQLAKIAMNLLEFLNR